MRGWQLWVHRSGECIWSRVVDNLCPCVRLMCPSVCSGPRLFSLSVWVSISVSSPMSIWASPIQCARTESRTGYTFMSICTVVIFSCCFRRYDCHCRSKQKFQERPYQKPFQNGHYLLTGWSLNSVRIYLLVPWICSKISSYESFRYRSNTLLAIRCLNQVFNRILADFAIPAGGAGVMYVTGHSTRDTKHVATLRRHAVDAAGECTLSLRWRNTSRLPLSHCLSCFPFKTMLSWQWRLFK